jgi:hypothetical protein
MATKTIGWAPGNIWFDLGYKHRQTKTIDGTSIKILSLPYYLATKFSAFNDRGGRDPRISHDFEDIVYILNYSSYVKDAILNSDTEVQQFLKEWFQNIIDQPIFQEAILGNLYYEDQTEHFANIINLIKDIVSKIT